MKLLLEWNHLLVALGPSVKYSGNTMPQIESVKVVSESDNFNGQGQKETHTISNFLTCVDG
jgi:hypothetical protein